MTQSLDVFHLLFTFEGTQLTSSISTQHTRATGKIQQYKFYFILFYVYRESAYCLIIH